MRHARQLFDPALGGQPIERVVLSDVEPEETASEDNGDFWLIPYLRIPSELHTRDTLGEFATQQQSLDALSSACVRYARGLVGLKVEEM